MSHLTIKIRSLSGLLAAALSIPAAAQPFVAQPANEHSSLDCWPDAAAPARSLQRHGIVFDYELATGTNAAVAGGFSTMIWQFNECFGGGMIDEIFDAANYPNLTLGAVSAASASRHNEPSWSTLTCAGGSDYGIPWVVAASPVPFTLRASFLFAERLDPSGPFAVPVLEHPQYKSNGAGADVRKIGMGGAAKKAIIFIGNDAGRNDYHADARRMHACLTGNGYAAANIDVLVGAGAANLLCGAGGDPVIAHRRATREDLIIGAGNAIAALPAGGVGQEYVLWFHDHGSRWKFMKGPGGAPQAVPLGANSGHNFQNDASFQDLAQDSTIRVYLESLSPQALPVRILVNDDVVYEGAIDPEDNVVEFTEGNQAVILDDENTVTVENLSTQHDLLMQSLAIGIGPVEPGSDAEPIDIGFVEDMKNEFGACCLAGGGCMEGLSFECDGDFMGAGTICADVECAAVDCPGDTNGDGQVNVADLVNVIVFFGTSGQGSGVDADLNDDGTVNIADLIAAILAWGPCA